MLHHRTQDPSQRAADIAENEAERVWKRSGNYELWSRTLGQTYEKTLREIHSETEPPQPRS